jgi:hypothetical protein
LDHPAQNDHSGQAQQHPIQSEHAVGAQLDRSESLFPNEPGRHFSYYSAGYGRSSARCASDSAEHRNYLAIVAFGSGSAQVYSYDSQHGLAQANGAGFHADYTDSAQDFCHDAEPGLVNAGNADTPDEYANFAQDFCHDAEPGLVNAGNADFLDKHSVFA